MKLIHSSITEVKHAQPKKQVPIYKDPIAIAEMTNWFLSNHNKKIKAKQA